MTRLQLTAGVLLSTLGLSLGACQQAPKADAAPGGQQAAVAAGTPVNAYCPIFDDNKVNPNLTAEWQGKTVAFCCAGCRAKWAKLSDQRKTEELAEAMAKTAK